MKDIFVGLIIIFVCAIIVDFIATEKNTCPKSTNTGIVEEYKCGFLKSQMNINFDLFNRYW